MLSGKLYTLGLVMFSVFCSLLIAIYSIMEFTQQRFQGSLQTVTEEAIYDARYDNARSTNKVFVLNKPVFEQDLIHSNIKDIANDSSLKLEYMHDDSNAAKSLNLTNSCIPIKAVKVTIVDGKNDHANQTITYIINSNSKTKDDDLSNN